MVEWARRRDECIQGIHLGGRSYAADKSHFLRAIAHLLKKSSIVVKSLKVG